MCRKRSETVGDAQTVRDGQAGRRLDLPCNEHPILRLAQYQRGHYHVRFTCFDRHALGASLPRFLAISPPAPLREV